MTYKLRAMVPVIPGITLLEVLRDKGISQADFARSIGRPIKLINEIVRCKASITPDTAIQFEEALGIEADFWLNLQKNYDLACAYGRKAIASI